MPGITAHLPDALVPLSPAIGGGVRHLHQEVAGGLVQHAQLVAQADGNEQFKAEVLALGRELLERADQRISAEDLAEADSSAVDDDIDAVLSVP